MSRGWRTPTLLAAIAIAAAGVGLYFHRAEPPANGRRGEAGRLMPRQARALVLRIPPEVERMLIVECTRARQDSIAQAIDEELARLAALRDGIEAKRREIDRLIGEAIRSAVARRHE